jgi:TRAP-type mannitol/chloroaromatic compound transport system permease large subunit
MFGALVAIMFTGMPIAFAFMFTCIMGATLFWGGWNGVDQLAMSFYSAVANYVFLPIPLFILMGDVIYEAGTGTLVVGAVDKIMGRFPGRLSLVTTGTGVLLGAPIGISGGTIGILGRVLLPEMEARKYKPEMSIGPIIATGTLAILIPPSALAVFIGAMGQVSVSKLLLAITIPGLILAAMMTGYIIIRCIKNPTLAPLRRRQGVTPGEAASGRHLSGTGRHHPPGRHGERVLRTGHPERERRARRGGVHRCGCTVQAVQPEDDHSSREEHHPGNGDGVLHRRRLH